MKFCRSIFAVLFFLKLNKRKSINSYIQKNYFYVASFCLVLLLLFCATAYASHEGDIEPEPELWYYAQGVPYWGIDAKYIMPARTCDQVAKIHMDWKNSRTDFSVTWANVSSCDDNRLYTMDALEYTGRVVEYGHQAGTYFRCPRGYNIVQYIWICRPAQSDHFINIADTKLFNDPAPQQTNSCPAGNPIHIDNGNKQQIETDYVSSGPQPLRFMRYYNSQTPDAATPDAYWQHSYFRKLSLTPYPGPITHDSASPMQSNAYNSRQDACEQGWEAVKSQLAAIPGMETQTTFSNSTCYISHQGKTWGTIAIRNVQQNIAPDLDVQTWTLQRPNGRILRFTWNQVDHWVSDGGNKATLTVDNTGFTYRDANDTIEKYDLEQRLVSITSRAGLIQTLNYTADGLLESVTNHFGQQLTFSHDAQNRLQTFTAPNDKVWTYNYSSSGQLETVTHPDDTTRYYHYEDTRFPHALTGITDEKNSRYATWTYNAQGRAISSEHANGIEKVTLAFNDDDSTTVTNALGKATTYHFKTENGVKRVAHVEGHPTATCAGANQAYTYDDNRFLASKTDDSVEGS